MRKLKNGWLDPKLRIWMLRKRKIMERYGTLPDGEE